MKKLLILIVSFFVSINIFSVPHDSGFPMDSVRTKDICPKVCAPYGGWYHEGSGQVDDNSPNLFCDCNN